MNIIPLQARDDLDGSSFETRSKRFKIQNPVPPDEEPFFHSLVLYRSALNDLPLIAVALIIGIGIGWLLSYAENYISLLLGQKATSIPMLSMLFGAGLLSAIIVFRRFNVKYLIGKDGVQAIQGILSNHQVDSKLEYYQIRGTEIHRTLFERLIGTGDLHVRGATREDTEVSFIGIYDPYRYQRLIQERHRLEAQNQNSHSLYLESNT